MLDLIAAIIVSLIIAQAHAENPRTPNQRNIPQSGSPTPAPAMIHQQVQATPTPTPASRPTATPTSSPFFNSSVSSPPASSQDARTSSPPPSAGRSSESRNAVVTPQNAITGSRTVAPPSTRATSPVRPQIRTQTDPIGRPSNTSEQFQRQNKTHTMFKTREERLHAKQNITRQESAKSTNLGKSTAATIQAEPAAVTQDRSGTPLQVGPVASSMMASQAELSAQCMQRWKTFNKNFTGLGASGNGQECCKFIYSELILKFDQHLPDETKEAVKNFKTAYLTWLILGNQGANALINKIDQHFETISEEKTILTKLIHGTVQPNIDAINAQKSNIQVLNRLMKVIDNFLEQTEAFEFKKKLKTELRSGDIPSANTILIEVRQKAKANLQSAIAVNKPTLQASSSVMIQGQGLPHGLDQGATPKGDPTRFEMDIKRLNDFCPDYHFTLLPNQAKRH